LAERLGRRSRLSWLWSGAIIIALALLLFLAKLSGDSLYNFSEFEISNPIASDLPIIVLAGGKGRIEFALETYANGEGNSLFIVGAGPKTTLSQILKSVPDATVKKINPKRLEAIAIDTQSKNTIENAYIVQRYFQTIGRPKKFALITHHSSLITHHSLQPSFIIKIGLQLCPDRQGRAGTPVFVVVAFVDISGLHIVI
jgi:uncharacterized SAM-binding protein YcdF (DUF218 family)